MVTEPIYVLHAGYTAHNLLYNKSVVLSVFFSRVLSVITNIQNTNSGGLVDVFLFLSFFPSLFFFGALSLSYDLFDSHTSERVVDPVYLSRRTS